jgi:hypothetical protein
MLVLAIKLAGRPAAVSYMKANRGAGKAAVFPELSAPLFVLGFEFAVGPAALSYVKTSWRVGKTCLVAVSSAAIFGVLLKVWWQGEKENAFRQNVLAGIAGIRRNENSAGTARQSSRGDTLTYPWLPLELCGVLHVCH